VKIIRSDRKTMSLTVEPDGDLIVRVPYRFREEQIQLFLKKHERWIRRRREILSSASRLCFDDGNTVMLFGSSYTVCSGEAKITDCRLFLPEEGREAALSKLLKPFCRDVLCRFTRQVAMRYGFSLRNVRISSARSRWGSCSGNNISYSFRVAFLPPALCEYVVVHELAHTRQMNHSAAFWREVERVLPDYAVRRASLKEYGWLMYRL